MGRVATSGKLLVAWTGSDLEAGKVKRKSRQRRNTTTPWVLLDKFPTLLVRNLHELLVQDNEH